MNSAPTNVEKLRAIPIIIVATFLRSIYLLTVTGTVFVLFLDELGIDKARIGVVMSIAPFIGIISLVIVPIVERSGLKRTTKIFWMLRVLITILIPVTPLIMKYTGETGVFVWLSATQCAFAVSGYIAVTAYASWYQELVPDRLRGKTAAINFIGIGLSTIITLAAAGYITDRFAGLKPFVFLMIGGLVIGFVAEVVLSRLPGGQPILRQEHHKTHLQFIKDALCDKNFMLMMAALVLINIAVFGAGAFVPLYQKQILGLSASQIMFSAMCYSVAVLGAYYFYGWAADRYGAKPVLIFGIANLVPSGIFWYLTKLPAGNEGRFAATIFVAVFFALTQAGWVIGFDRYVYNTLIPVGKKTSYLSIQHAVGGVAAGVGPLVTGWLIEICKPLNSTTIMGVKLDAYIPFFVLYGVLTFASVMLLKRLKQDSQITTQQFVGMFFQGDPLTALHSMARYRMAKGESERIDKTSDMGMSSSPLNVEELLEALHDPSFNVRYEAVIAISRRKPHPKLTEALINILLGPDLELAASAAWALGRIGDKSAIGALRECLAVPYPLLQARAARTLGALGDVESSPMLLDWLRSDIDPTLKRACASALGALRVPAALPDIFNLLLTNKRASFRGELTMAMARTVGSESQFINLWRRMNEDTATAEAHQVIDTCKSLAKLKISEGPIVERLNDCAEKFASGRTAEATKIICDIAVELPTDGIDHHIIKLMNLCRQQLLSVPQQDHCLLALLLHIISTMLRRQVVQVKRAGKTKNI